MYASSLISTNAIGILYRPTLPHSLDYGDNLITSCPMIIQLKGFQEDDVMSGTVDIIQGHPRSLLVFMSACTLRIVL